MINQKRKKNKIFYYHILIFFLNLTFLNANENKCKKYDIKCKANKHIEETKQFQKKGLSEGKDQLNKTKKGLTKVKKKILELLPNQNVN